MPRPDIKIDVSGLRQIVRTAGLDLAKEAADGVQARAESISPVGDDEGGHYRDQFGQDVVEVRARTFNRPGVLVYNGSAYWAAVEARHSVLNRSLG